MDDVINQFLDLNDKYIVNFTTMEELQNQKGKVRNAIRQSVTDRDFDILDSYYQMLKNIETNIILEKEYNEYR